MPRRKPSPLDGTDCIFYFLPDHSECTRVRKLHNERKVRYVPVDVSFDREPIAPMVVASLGEVHVEYDEMKACMDRAYGGKPGCD